MDICLIRHAEPDWHPGGRHRMDPELSAQGHDQARRLAERATGWPWVDEVWVSPATRSQQTAAPLVEALGQTVRTLDWLLEVQPMNLEGKTREEVRALFKGARARSVEDWWEGHRGGDNLRDRISAGFDEEITRLGGQRAEAAPHWRDLPAAMRIVVVSHAGTSGAALSHLLGVPHVPWAWERFRLGHAGMVVVRSAPMSEGHIFQLHSFNDRGHLPQEMHTA